MWNIVGYAVLPTPQVLYTFDDNVLSIESSMISKLMYIVIFRRLSLRFKMLCSLEKSDCLSAAISGMLSYHFILAHQSACNAVIGMPPKMQAYYILSAGIMISSRYKIDDFSAEMFYFDEI